jgi:hypothetical protein
MKKLFLLISIVLLGLSVSQGVAQAAVMREASGLGNAVADLGTIRKSVIVEFTFVGAGPFVAVPVFAKEKNSTPWIESDAPASGSLFVEKHSSSLIGAKITAPDQWTLRVRPITSAPKITAGKTPIVVKLSKLTKRDTVRTFVYRGSGDVVVFPISAKGMSGFPVVNSSGSVKKKIILPRGTKYISIWANGPWKLKK